ncbi:MAG: 12-oxophytodienoate reductase [Alphaproteobacteria bacterium]|nr:12-oxophytodienoate reductase [Alphaproteobacteria bacterium]
MTDLFSPFQLKSLSLPNRVVMAPMTRSKSPGSVPGPDVAAYYARRAAGGVGLIISEGTTVDRPGASNDTNIPNFHAPESLAGWARVVEAVHAAGGKFAPQIWHQGMIRNVGAGAHPDAPSDGPSGLSASGKQIGEPMSDADIADTIDAFAKATVDAKRIGCDAVEFHGAHGYLIDQFFWEQSNRRSDRFGGDMVARTTFAAEIVREARKRAGPDFPLIFRFSQWKQQDFDARLAPTPDDLARFLAPLADAGVDIFHCSTRRFWEPEFEGSPLNLAGWTKKLTGLPTMTVGSVGLKGADFVMTFRGESSAVGDFTELEARLAADEFDLVAVGRALISDPDWAVKVRERRFDALSAFEPSALAELV